MTSPGESSEAGRLAPRSIDRVRVIRRSMRCQVFGLIGLLPLFGAGFAYQALRLKGSVSAEVGDDWRSPPVYCYWLVGALAMLAVNRAFDLAGDVALCVVLLALQAWHVWRRFQRRRAGAWNPGDREVFLGVLFAYTGLGFSLWAVVVVVLQVLQALNPA